MLEIGEFLSSASQGTFPGLPLLVQGSSSNDAFAFLGALPSGVTVSLTSPQVLTYIWRALPWAPHNPGFYSRSRSDFTHRWSPYWNVCGKLPSFSNYNTHHQSPSEVFGMRSKQTFLANSRKSYFVWIQRGSNPWPRDCKSRALATELCSLIK